MARVVEHLIEYELAPMSIRLWVNSPLPGDLSVRQVADALEDAVLGMARRDVPDEDFAESVLKALPVLPINAIQVSRREGLVKFGAVIYPDWP
jgi:hypothetical protein